MPLCHQLVKSQTSVSFDFIFSELSLKDLLDCHQLFKKRVDVGEHF